MSVDPAVAAAIQSGDLPASVTADYLMESRDRPAKIAILSVGVLTAIIVSLRIFSRWSVRRLYIDDAFAVCSLVFQVAFVVIAILLIDIGTGRRLPYIEYVMTPSQTKTSEVLDFSAHLIYTTALFSSRLSGLAFYRRLCELHSRLSVAINCALVFLIAAYLPQMALIIFHCNPVTALWPYSWQLEYADYVCQNWGLVYAVNSGLSVLCDLVMFAIPVGLIRTLSISPRKKLHLYLVLLPGVLVIIISLVRVYLVIEGGWYPVGSWDYDPMLAIENAEIGGTLIALSIPGLKPLVDKELSKLGGLPPSTERQLLAKSHVLRVKTAVTSGTFCDPISLVKLAIRAQE
ncbi:hypothetical protein OIDMADRAFT_39725 [Oidiodendron maius Zn]|uniref:Rhodopsin domain-containing protein n=1 Tax=Oidiodendron maius (strain Zn) TaxID=913774 RepID=A0A0C3DMX6_OIDMZ|nr:hypothetical protein OIDMADRAFT_39725 [Oidiodendron maius Zn]